MECHHLLSEAFQDEECCCLLGPYLPLAAGKQRLGSCPWKLPDGGQSGSRTLLPPSRRGREVAGLLGGQGSGLCCPPPFGRAAARVWVSSAGPVLRLLTTLGSGGPSMATPINPARGRNKLSELRWVHRAAARAQPFCRQAGDVRVPLWSVFINVLS